MTDKEKILIIGNMFENYIDVCETKYKGNGEYQDITLRSFKRFRTLTINKLKQLCDIE